MTIRIRILISAIIINLYKYEVWKELKKDVKTHHCRILLKLPLQRLGHSNAPEVYFSWMKVSTVLAWPWSQFYDRVQYHLQALDLQRVQREQNLLKILRLIFNFETFLKIIYVLNSTGQHVLNDGSGRKARPTGRYSLPLSKASLETVLAKTTMKELFWEGQKQ